MNSLIAKRYAKALYNLVLKSKRVHEYEKEITILYNTCAENKRLHELLTGITCRKKLPILHRAIPSAASLLHNFLRILAKNKRMALLFDILQQFIALQRERRGELVVTVISAIKLTRANLARVRSILKSLFRKKIIITNLIDKNVLGGFIALTDNYLCDASLASKLKRLAHTSKLALRNEHNIKQLQWI